MEEESFPVFEVVLLNELGPPFRGSTIKGCTFPEGLGPF